MYLFRQSRNYDNGSNKMISKEQNKEKESLDYRSAKKNTARGIISKTISIMMLSAVILTPSLSFGYSASPYPVIEGSPNSQEIWTKMVPSDIAANEAVSFALGARLMSLDPSKAFRPGEQLTQAQALALVINSSGNAGSVKPNPADWKKGYISAASSLGILSPEDISKGKENDYSLAVTNEQFSRWMSSALGKDFLYSGSPASNISRKNAADLIYANKQIVLSGMGDGISKGEIQSTSQITEGGAASMLITVKSDEGGYFNVLANKDKNFPVLRYGTLSQNPASFAAGDRAEFYQKNGRVYFAQALSNSPSSVKGTFEGLQGSNIIIRDYTDKQLIYPYAVDALFYTKQNTLNGEQSKPIGKNELIYGQDVDILLKNNVAQEIHAFLDIDPDLNGYIPEQSRMKAGKVLEAGFDYVILDDNSRYAVADDTFVSKSGKLSDMSFIKPGDIVKLYFDDIYTQKASRLDIEGDQRHIDMILKARIAGYSQGMGKLNLADVQLLSGDRWITADSAYSSLLLSDELYIGSAKTDKAKLNSYKDQEIYMAVSKNQNRPKIEKANVRLGNPVSYSDQIANVDHALSYFSIDGNTVNFSDGAIIVKDSRLVDSRNIDPSLSAFVEAGGIGKNASLVAMNSALVDSKDGSGYTIYRGTFDDVLSYKFTLYNDKDTDDDYLNYYYINTGKSWDTKKAGKDGFEIVFNDSTRFYDADNKKQIATADIKELRYADPDEDDDTGLLKRQIYAVTRNGQAIAVVFEKDTASTSLVNAQNTMLARFGEVKDNKTALTQISKYNALTEVFVPSQLSEQLDISSAIVIMDGKSVAPGAYGQLSGKKARVIYKQQTTLTNKAIVVIVEN